MRIALLCATNRGLRALQTLRALAPKAELLVVTCPETTHEPRYASNIQAFSQENGCRFTKQTDISKPPASDFFAETVDLLFCVSWRYMVPSDIYRATRLGSYVFHDSLLPKYRGFSPAIWALINGDREVGVTLFEMAELVDSGPIVGQSCIPVSVFDDIGTIREKGTTATCELLARYLGALSDGTVHFTNQNESEATYCCKWLPSDARIDWSSPRESILNLIRATTSPYPGAFCYLGNDKLTVWKASLPAEKRRFTSFIPGALSSIHQDGAVGILTGDGELLVSEVSLNEGPRMPAAECLRSYSTRLK